MTQRITRDEVVHVARLARLSLSDAEIDEFTGQLGDILEHAADIEALDVGDVEPTSHPLPMVNVLRPGELRPALDRDLCCHRLRGGRSVPCPADPGGGAVSALDLASAVRSGERSAVDVIDEHLARIDAATARSTPSISSPPMLLVRRRLRSTLPLPQERIPARSPVCRSRSRTTCAPRASPQRARRKSSRDGNRPTTPRSCSEWWLRVRSWSARPTSTSSRWVRPRELGVPDEESARHDSRPGWFEWRFGCGSRR